MNSHDPEKLEAALHRALRSVPDRGAPSALERRVLAEISRRAALPWWRQSYAHWPVAARVVFFAGSAAAAALVVMALVSSGLTAGASEVAGSVSRRLGWLVVARELAGSLRDRAALLVGSVPTLWFYGIAGAIAASYAALAAIGAATYRALSTGRFAQ